MALLQKVDDCTIRALGGLRQAFYERFQMASFSRRGDPLGSGWYCKYGVSYRDLEDMLCERDVDVDVDVDHTTIYRWVQRYAPEMEKRLRWYWKRPSMWRSWRVDETYVKVKEWVYLYQAVDKRGDTIDFYLSPTRNAKAAKSVLGKALAGLKGWEKPETINGQAVP